ncbi:MAG: hypothetical protein WC710_14090 [Gallionella sp.]|jgi:hypothetical protein
MTERQGRYRVKRDANQGEIEQALTAAGYVWFDTSKLGGGFPDLAVKLKQGSILLIEVKDGKGQLTPDERVFHDLWEDAPVIVARNPEDLIAYLNTWQL